MDVLKLIVIFITILIGMRMKKPLYISMAFGILLTIILYRIEIGNSLYIMFKGATSSSTIYLVLAFYSITFLQRMLEKRGHLILAEQSLSNIFNSRRVNAMIAPFIIGLLPSAGAVLIAAPIVDNAGDNYISKEEKENYLVLLQDKDEVLDYRQAVEYYQGQQVIIEAGGNHRFENLNDYLKTIDEFFIQAGL